VELRPTRTAPALVFSTAVFRTSPRDFLRGPIKNERKTPDLFTFQADFVVFF
jgi:hypothetical protein